MSAIIQKLAELGKLNLTLPISKSEIQINKINLELQSKFEQFAEKAKNEIIGSVQFIQFIHNHIRKEVGGDVGYLDKLYILQQWYNDLKEDKPLDHEINDIQIKDLDVTIKGAPFKFEFELPSITKELAFLKYILAKKSELRTIDVLFYFTFRFISKIHIDGETLDVTDIELTETLFKHLDMKKVNVLTDYIDDTFKSIKPIKDLEVDARVFFAL